MLKKMLATVSATVLVFGTSAVLPESIFDLQASIRVSADEGGDISNSSRFYYNDLYRYEGYQYTGKEIKPKIEIYDDNYGKELKEGTDFKAVYTNNINPGTAKVTITGTGNYYGTLTFEFTIEGKEIGKTEFKAGIKDSRGNVSFYYTGKPIEPKLNVYDIDGKLLKEGTDYKLKYFRNTYVGTADIEIVGLGMYASSNRSQAVVFKIVEPDNSDISAGSASIAYSSYTYRGRGIKPTVTVKDSKGNKLTKGTDYTVSYSNNTNVGTATITVKGKGKYTGTLKKTFKVKPLDLTSSYAKVTIPYSAYTYSGSGIKPKVTVKFKDGDIIPTSDYSLSYSNNTKVGVATITVKGKGSNVTNTYKKTFVVKPSKNEITSISTTKGAFKIGWKKGTTGTVGYQVQYSTDKNFVKNVHSYTSTNLSDLSENFSKVPNSGETWYVKVRSFYTKDGKTTSTRYGNYSDVKSIKVK